MLITFQSMLSLAKLAYLASDENEEKIEDKVKKIDCELMLIAHQEDVPTHILEMYGYDVDKLRVLSPSELINVGFKLRKLEILELKNKSFLFFSYTRA